MPAEIPGYVAGTWDFDPVHSHIGFAARQLMVSKVRGRFTQVRRAGRDRAESSRIDSPA
jgi:polyisoprenoid-binding protein YceI